MLTTSRYASMETRRFASQLSKENEEWYVSRGKKTIKELVSFARRKGIDKIKIVKEQYCKPFELAIIKVYEDGTWKWTGSLPLSQKM